MKPSKLNHVESLAQQYALDLDYLSNYFDTIVNEEGNFEGESEEYFWERVLGIAQERSRDVWVSRWELKGLLSRLGSSGHSLRGQESHIGGVHGPAIPHYNVVGRDVYGNRFKKHLFITDDPSDPRLYRHEAYDPNHPSE